MKLCDACGSPLNGGIGMGGAILCRTCEPDIQVEMDKLRTAGKSVNVMHIARRIYKETHSGGDYFLRDVPEDLLLRAKHRALDDGGSLRDLILSALHAYLK